MDEMKSYLTHKIGEYKVNPRIPVVCFDFDNTLTDAKVENKEYYPPRQDIVDLFNFCKNLGYKTLILTARPRDSHLATKINARMIGANYDRIITNDYDEPVSFKRNIRQALEDQGQDIVLSVGDKIWDIKDSPHATIKINSSNYDYFIPTR